MMLQPSQVANAEPDVTGTPTFQIKNAIDKYVLVKLREEKIDPSGPCTDEEFLRRVYLDLCGSVPPLAEAKAFLADHSANKRANLVKKLLDSDRYADHWTALWGDLLREHSNSRPQEGTDRGSYREWITLGLKTNMPYDIFAKSLIDAIGNADEDPAVNFYLRDEMDRVETVNNISTVFMGTRMACAQCHDHPFDKWTQNDFHGLMAFFGRVNVNIDPWTTLIHVENSRRLPTDAKPILEPYFKEAHEKVAAEKAAYKKGIEVAENGGGATGMGGGMSMMENMQLLGRGGKLIKDLEAKLNASDMQVMRQMLLNGGVRKVGERGFGEYRMPKEGDSQNKRGQNGGEIVAPKFPWDPSLKADGPGSRRTKLAKFVTESRQFAAVQVNRLWANVMGRGIVDPVDDFRTKNPPTNADLLDYLTDEFINSKFDNKHMLELIVNSSTYQRSSIPNTTNRSDTTLFSHARVRRLTAEQLFDSLLVATGKNNGLSDGSGFGMGMGREMMANRIMDGMYGAKSKSVQWAVDLPTPAQTGTFMNAFNQPDRNSTVCKREESGSIVQALEMMNGEKVNGAIRGSAAIKQMLDAKLSPQQIAQDLFLSVLTRMPTSSEVQSVCSRAPATTDPKAQRDWIEDVYWALFNTREFTFVK